MEEDGRREGVGEWQWRCVIRLSASGRVAPASEARGEGVCGQVCERETGREGGREGGRKVSA